MSTGEAKAHLASPCDDPSQSAARVPGGASPGVGSADPAGGLSRTGRSSAKGWKTSEASIQDGKAKRKKMVDTHSFFAKLTDRERELFCVVTEDIPLQSTAGLQSIKKRLWKGHEANIKLAFAIKCGQLAINLYTVTRMAALVNVLSPPPGMPVFEEGSMRICSDRLEPECFEAKLRNKIFIQFAYTMEFAAVLVMGIALGSITIYFFCCPDPKKFAGKGYFALMVLPRIASKFSLMMFLHMSSLERLQRFVRRGEFRCLLGASCYGFRSNAGSGGLDLEEVQRMRNPNDDSKQATSIRRDVIGMLCCFVLAVAGLHFLLVKLTMVYFAGLFPYIKWTFREWLMFGGFANQLSGIALSTETQMLRVFLFKFGGEDTNWQSAEIEACSVYLHLFAMRLVEQLGCMRALMVFWTMTSADLQSLFQGKLRYLEQAAVRDEELEMMQKLDSREELDALRDSLLEGSKIVEASMEESLNEAVPSERMEVLQMCQARMIGQLRLAARVQEHVWEWRKVALLEECKVVPHSVEKLKADSSTEEVVPFPSHFEHSPQSSGR
jgi:hypothetical protein